MKRLTGAMLALLVVLAPAAQADAHRHMIAAANPYAARAGLEMLRKGGSAVDAAIATQMVLTLVEPESSGIGGGAFMLVWDPATKRMTSFDGRETAPASATPTMFLDASGRPRAKGDAIPGGLSVGVPGVLAMLELAHKRYGKLPWAALFQPAIRLAEEGVPVTGKLARQLRSNPKIAAMPDVKRYFTRSDGSLVEAGDVLKNPELAATFRIIAGGGARAFYKGPIARAIVEKVRHAPVNPTTMTRKDVAGYRAVERKPVCGSFRRNKVCSMGPPSSGGIAVLQILSMLEQHAPEQPGTVQGIHLMSQATRLAFADRMTFIGDPAFVRVPVKGLLDNAYLAQRGTLISASRDMGTAEPGNPPHAAFAPQIPHERHGTSHMSIVDDAGRVVSMTTTVESLLGSEMMVKGFFLNNQLTDFSFEPMRGGKPVANAVAPGKRPMSAMAPTIVLDSDGRFRIALGSPGGPAIISYVAEALVAMIDGGASPERAAALPRHVMGNGPLLLEKDTPLGALAPQFEAMGYKVRPASVEMSGLHIVARTPNGYTGAADPRREGVVLGD